MSGVVRANEQSEMKVRADSKKLGNEPFVSLDFTKLFFALLVPCLHISQFNSPDFGYFCGQYLGSLAVPFFFICSGFLLKYKLIKQKQLQHLSEKGTWKSVRRSLFKKQVLRILVLYGLWEIIYLPISWLLHWNGNLFLSLISWLQYQLFAADGALWFLMALVVGLVLLYFVKGRARIPLAIALYACGLFLNTYSFLIPDNYLTPIYFKIFITARNGVFEAFPFLVLGFYIASQWCGRRINYEGGVTSHQVNGKNSQEDAPTLRLMIMTLGAIAVLFIEIYCVRHIVPSNADTSLFIFLPVAAYYLFYTLLLAENRIEEMTTQVLRFFMRFHLREDQVSSRGSDGSDRNSSYLLNKASILARKASMGIYLIQIWVIYSCLILAPIIGVLGNGYIVWLLVVLIGFFLAYLSTKIRLVRFFL